MIVAYPIQEVLIANIERIFLTMFRGSIDKLRCHLIMISLKEIKSIILGFNKCSGTKDNE